MKKNTPEILIIVPPFASVDFPMIGPGLLAAACKARGLSVRIVYANMLLAAKIGYLLYQRISVSSFSIMAGELLFRDFAFPGLFEKSADTFRRHFETNKLIQVSSPQFKPISEEEISFCSREIGEFLKELYQEIQLQNPEIIGISSVFQQNLASIALARMIKRNTPEKIVVLGGANTSEPMGGELLKAVPFIDYVFSGEADFEFAGFAEAYLKTGELPDRKVIECTPVKDMNQVPYPDYSDYFNQLSVLQGAGKLPNGLPLKIPIETSRGCWWGAKKHCTFCGLNGNEMSFREKGAERILEEVDFLGSTYQLRSFQATDNIMPQSFKKEVLPRLGRQTEKNSFFYEVKSNLKADELDLFCKAGVAVIQPGIESFSSHILQLISKGVKGIQNLWLLRECLSRQIQVVWNILTHIPDDELIDYQSMQALVAKIQHFNPPQGVSQIIIDRFSPYHSYPERYGITGIQPLPAYSLLYPSNFNLADTAYHFTAKYNTVFNDREQANLFCAHIEDNWIKKWMSNEQPPKLYSVSLGDGRCFVEDTRHIAKEQRVVLESETVNTLNLFRQPLRDLQNANTERFEYLLNMNYIIHHEGYWMSIVAEPEKGFNLRKSKLDASAQPAAQTFAPP
jgi:ribosomal peptide maturation radical SAM protein 1